MLDLSAACVYFLSWIKLCTIIIDLSTKKEGNMEDLPIKNGIVIPGSELEVVASRSGGPGGQHVNVTNTRITLRWNIPNTSALGEIQKARVMEKLQSKLTTEGDLIVHNSTGRSQQQNKEMAFANLAEMVRTALIIPKKRKRMRISKSAKEARLQSKTHRSTIKKLRNKKIQDY
ncbi:MAG: alternative ribosome rescue aminoacyl-tRNA hydrolase ArfB [Candidatus Babeliaceae bacterium]|jgi:ribosome-associated protein